MEIIILSPHYPGARKQEIMENIKIYRFQYFITKYEKLCYNNGILSNIKKKWSLSLLVPFFVFFQIIYLKKIIKKEKINIIHAHWIIPQGSIAVLYKKLFNKKIKIICTSHGTDILGLKNPLFKKIKKYTIKNIDYIVTVSKTLFDKINKIGNKPKTQIISNVINTRIFHSGINTLSLKKKYKINSFCLLFVGRVIKEKGTEELVKAMPKILKIFPKTKLLIIGSGNKLNYLQKLTKNLKISSKVLFLKTVPNRQLPSFYNLADIFILPSHSEGQSLVCLEAMACQTAVIAAKSGALPEIIKHNFTGILIEKNTPSHISRAVINLLKNNSKRKLLAYNGLNYIKTNFHPQRIAKQYNKIYS